MDGSSFHAHDLQSVAPGMVWWLRHPGALAGRGRDPAPAPCDGKLCVWSVPSSFTTDGASLQDLQLSLRFPSCCSCAEHLAARLAFKPACKYPPTSKLSVLFAVCRSPQISPPVSAGSTVSLSRFLIFCENIAEMKELSLFFDLSYAS